MIHRSLRACIFASAAAALVVSGAFAQEPKLELPQASPTSTVKQRVGVTDIEITYSRPSVKDRKIFGGLLPWNEVWRAGANNATKIVFSTPVKLNGTSIPAGTYGLFAIPGQNEWQVILNKISKQWGAYTYSAEDDVARIPAKPQALTQPVETFLIDINDIRDESATLNLIWETTRVPVKIEVDVLATVVPQIEAVMSGPGQKKPYVAAAMFYLDHKLDLKKALGWMDAAIAEQPKGFYLHYRKAKILAAMGDKPAALATAKQSIELAKADKSPAGPEYIRLNEALIADLK